MLQPAHIAYARLSGLVDSVRITRIHTDYYLILHITYVMLYDLDIFFLYKKKHALNILVDHTNTAD